MVPLPRPPTPPHGLASWGAGACSNPLLLTVAVCGKIFPLIPAPCPRQPPPSKPQRAKSVLTDRTHFELLGPRERAVPRNS